MTSTWHVLHQDDVDVALSLDRAPYERLAAAVLTWTDPGALPPCDYEHIALQLTGHAREVAADVRRLAGELPPSSGRRALADLVLAEAEQHLEAPPGGTLRCVQGRAQVVRSLYARLDRLSADEPPGPPSA